MKYLARITAATIVALVGFANLSTAAILSQYTIPDLSHAPTTEAAGVIASDLTNGGTGTFGALDRDGSNSSNLATSTGITLIGSAVFAPGTQSEDVVRKGYPTSFASPVTASTRYIQFTLTPDSVMSLSSIHLDVGKGGANNRGFRLGYSIDGFTSATTLGGADFASSLAAWAFGNFTFDLSGISELQNTSNTVIFRLYGRVDNDNNQMGFDNITINGVIPEPMSLALLATGCLMMLPRSRRQRSLHR